jgi:hypothetical protein
MKIQFACLADQANVDTRGKLNITGVFDRISAPSFPVQQHTMFLVIRLLLEFSDNEKVNRIQVVLRDEDNKIYWRADGQIQHGDVSPGSFASANQILELRGIMFDVAGRYEFVLTADDEPPVVVPFVLTALP